MFKKGHRPHNKGDSYVRSNYRNKPVEKAEDEILEHSGPSLHFRQNMNPYRLHIGAHDVVHSVNNLKSDRVKLF